MRPLATITLLWAFSLGPVLVNAQKQSTTPRTELSDCSLHRHRPRHFGRAWDK